jgi:hypothetical protein
VKTARFLRVLIDRLLCHTATENMSSQVQRRRQTSEESDSSCEANTDSQHEPFSEPCPHLQSLEQDLKNIAKNRISNPALWNCEGKTFINLFLEFSLIFIIVSTMV